MKPQKAMTHLKQIKSFIKDYRISVYEIEHLQRRFMKEYLYNKWKDENTTGKTTSEGTTQEDNG